MKRKEPRTKKVATVIREPSEAHFNETSLLDQVPGDREKPDVFMFISVWLFPND